MNRIFLIVGATGGIARALGRQLASRGYGLVLAGRDVGELEAIAADLATRHDVEATPISFDAEQTTACATLLARASAAAGRDLHGLIVCHGRLSPEAGPASPEAVESLFRVNLVSVAVILEQAADYFGERGHGVIVAISSVAGDRGRQSNYLYGSSKAGLTAMLSGLRNRLHPRGVTVLTVKPGFVDTPMLDGRRPQASWLVASPDRVARGIVAAIERRRDVVYTPRFWRGIMAVIRLIPESVFKRLRL